MKVDRLIGILSVLLQKEKVTAPYLASKFEVSRRTINRDIEALCRAGIPVTTSQGANGGISIMDGYAFDRTLLTSSELQAVLAGLRSLDSVSGTDRYGQLMEKLAPGTSGMLTGDQHLLIDLSSWYKASLAPKIEMIHKAIEQGQQLQFYYYSPKGDTKRRMEPYYLIFQWANWYVWGWCTEKQDFRLFKLNRMAELQALGERFERRKAPMPDLSSERIFPVKLTVKALFEPNCQWRLIEEFGRDSFTKRADGKLLFSFAFGEPENIISWILSFGEKAELLEPADVREKLRRTAGRLNEKYTGDGQNEI